AVRYTPNKATDTESGYAIPYTSNAPHSIIQTRALPTVAIVLTGRALRAGYSITPPSIVSVGGIVPVPQGNPNSVRQSVVCNLGVAVVAASWSIRYLLPQIPNGMIVAPFNPIDGGPAVGP